MSVRRKRSLLCAREEGDRNLPGLLVVGGVDVDHRELQRVARLFGRQAHQAALREVPDLAARKKIRQTFSNCKQ